MNRREFIATSVALAVPQIPKAAANTVKGMSHKEMAHFLISLRETDVTLFHGDEKLCFNLPEKCPSHSEYEEKAGYFHSYENVTRNKNPFDFSITVKYDNGKLTYFDMLPQQGSICCITVPMSSCTLIKVVQEDIISYYSYNNGWNLVAKENE